MALFFTQILHGIEYIQPTMKTPLQERRGKTYILHPVL